jgi:hypothetical protein
VYATVKVTKQISLFVQSQLDKLLSSSNKITESNINYVKEEARSHVNAILVDLQKIKVRIFMIDTLMITMTFDEVLSRKLKWMQKFNLKGLKSFLFTSCITQNFGRYYINFLTEILNTEIFKHFLDDNNH